MKRKGKRKMLIAVIVLVIVAAATAGGSLMFTAGERNEGKNLPIAAVDFKNLNDGIYVGEYEGGMNKWRANKVQVTVSAGKVAAIQLIMHKENQSPEFTDKLFNRVIESQSLQVDVISGATITSKAYLKGIEKALNNAGKK